MLDHYSTEIEVCRGLYIFRSMAKYEILHFQTSRLKCVPAGDEVVEGTLLKLMEVNLLALPIRPRR